MKHVWILLYDTCRGTHHTAVRLITEREGRGRSGEESAYRGGGVLIGRLEGKEPLGRREDNIKVDPKETG
jgi:hypothetical protein